MKSRVWQSVLVLCFLALGVGFGIFSLFNQPEPKYYDDGLPVFDLKLNGASLDVIKEGDKSLKYPGNQLSIIAAGQESEYFNVEIKGRGNSTWDQPKKPFQIEFRYAVDLFGMGKARKWVLLANIFDDTNLRNDIAMRLAEMLDEDFSHRGRFIELYFDGKYEGLYYLIHKVEIGKNSVDLRDESGILVELEVIDRVADECNAGLLGGCLVLKESVNKNDEMIEEEAFDVFLDDYRSLEKAAMAGDFETVNDLIDVESFAKYYLVSEFTINPDAYSMSFFMHKNNFADKIHAGPIWDFDYALGNRNWNFSSEDFYSPEQIMTLKKSAFSYDLTNEFPKISKLFFYLMDMPEFRGEVERVFREKWSGRERELMIYVANIANQYRRAILRDSEKWEKDDFDEEMDYLFNWIEKRFRRLELEFGDLKKPEVNVQ